MIFLTLIEDLYFISHYSKKNATEKLFVFHKSFLPDQVVRHLHSLSVLLPGNSQSLVLEMVLTAKQNQEATVIFQKLCYKKSGYIFEEQLQKTHLIELIHLITRIHQHASFQI